MLDTISTDYVGATLLKLLNYTHGLNAIEPFLQQQQKI